MKLKVNAPLDPEFAPMVMEFREFEEAAEKSGGKKIVIGIERNKGYISTYEMTVFEDGCGHDDENFAMAERIVKDQGGLRLRRTARFRPRIYGACLRAPLRGGIRSA